MKLCRFDDGRIGVVRDEWVYDVTDRLGKAGAREARGDRMAVVRAAAALPAEAVSSAPRLRVGEVRIGAPVARPGKIIAAPVNYAAHVREMEAAGLLAAHGSGDITAAGLFLKAPSALAGPADGIALRFPERRTDHEVELVAVIGVAASGVAPEAALAHVAGYCIGLDITLRGPEDRSFRKSIDTYAMVGPWLTTADEIADPQSLRLTLHRNGDPRQEADTADMVMNVAELVAFASRFYTLEPGDLLFTGSPQGVGPIRPGDLLLAEATGLGAMSVAVRLHDPSPGGH